MDVTYDDIVEARARIANHVHVTPVMTSRMLNAQTGCRVFMKCENFQRAGSFKIRGASNFLSRLTPEERGRGVVAHSSGNHAQALALAARLFGAPAHIVMPRTAPAIKQAATQGYGAEVTLCEPTLAARDEAAEKILAETGGTQVHPYDHPYTIMGQGTLGLEFLEQAPEVDLLLVPVSGGGLISGVALAAAHCGRPVTVIGVEPATADDAWRSYEAGKLVQHDPGPTIADGLQAHICERTFAIMRQYVASIVRVTDDRIRQAMYWLWTRAKLMVEPSGAVVLAALLANAEQWRGRNVGLILSGGNMDLPRPQEHRPGDLLL